MPDRIGQQLGNYRLARLLGKGGFAEVYLGEHVYLETQAAIKVLLTQLADEDIEPFRLEAKRVAHLEHPHIVRVLDFGVDGTTPYLVMSYAPNGTLRQRHPKGVALPLPTILGYVKQAADALQYAHDEHFIHRDVKPENFLVGRRQEVLLSDFGIALLSQTSRSQSMQDVAGTASYMAPEQFQGKPRPASDQYSLGIIVYEWLTGDRPFHGSFTEIASQHLFVPPPPFSESMASISPAVEQVVMTALAKDPKQRFGNVQAFATALEQAMQTETSHTLPASHSVTPIEVRPQLRSIQPSPELAPFLSESLIPTELITPPSQPAIPTELVVPHDQHSLPGEPLNALNRAARTDEAIPSSNTSRDSSLSAKNLTSAMVPTSPSNPQALTIPVSQPKTEPPRVLVPNAGMAHPPQKTRQSTSQWRKALVIGLVLLVVVGGAGLFFTISMNQAPNNTQATNTAQSNLTTLLAQNTPTAASTFSNIVGTYSGNYQLAGSNPAGGSRFSTGITSMTLYITGQSQESFSGTCTLGTDSYQITEGKLDQSGFIQFSINAQVNNSITTLLFTSNSLGAAAYGYHGNIADLHNLYSGTWYVS